MANTIRWYDRNWNQVASLAIGALSLIGGVHHDGLLYWITDQTGATGSVQAFTIDGGVFNRVVVFTLPTGYSAPTGITGDGHNLYVACTLTDAGPPPVVTRTVLMFTKTGVLLKDLAFGSPTSVQQIDLDFNGQNLLRCVHGVAAGEVFQYVDIPAQTPIYESPDLRPPYAMTFDGQNHPTIVLVTGFYYGTMYDHDGTNLLQAITVLSSAQPYGCCMVHGQESELGFESSFGGESIAVAWRA